MEWIPWSISGISLLFVILTFVRTWKKDGKAEDAEENAKFDSIKEGLVKANMKLDQVCATTTELRSDVKSMNHELKQYSERLIIVERDLKTAFRQIDDLRDQMRGVKE